MGDQRRLNFSFLGLLIYIAFVTLTWICYVNLTKTNELLHFLISS